MKGKREQGLLICMPIGRCPDGVHLERECFVCHGKVGVNPGTFKSKGVPSDLVPVCGACAIDLIDSDGENHEFRLTETQQEIGKVIKALKGENWPKAAIEYVRQHRALYGGLHPC
jgi:hypothetical protein